MSNEPTFETQKRFNDATIKLQNGEPIVESEPNAHLPLDSKSKAWAEIVKWAAKAIIVLTFVVIVLPFIMIVFVSLQGHCAQIDFLERWSSMILAPVIGLVGIVVGYYFGSNGAGN